MSGVIAGPEDPTIPIIQAVADVIPRRAHEGNGLTGGTFDSNTSPTGPQVARISATYLEAVTTALGGTIPAALATRAPQVVALGAAAQVELAFFPEDSDNVAKTLFERYDLALKQLIAEAEASTGEDLPGDENGTSSGSPLFAFDEVTDDLSRLTAGYGATPAADWTGLLPNT